MQELFRQNAYGDTWQEPELFDQPAVAAEQPHRCRVVTTTSRHPGHQRPTVYVATCEKCGPVGVPQDDQRDAQAIADRHEEIGGFER